MNQVYLFDGCKDGVIQKPAMQNNVVVRVDFRHSWYDNLHNPFEKQFNSDHVNPEIMQIKVKDEITNSCV
jgi:hypothetical protein